MYHRIVDTLLASPLLKYVSNGEEQVEDKSGMSFNKDMKNDIGSVDRPSKNNENAHPIVHSSADPTTPPFVEPNAHSSPPPPLNAYVSPPTAHVSSPAVAAASPHVAHVFSPAIYHTAATALFTAAPTSSYYSVPQLLMNFHKLGERLIKLNLL
ncbi:hypothetical protein P3S67_021421 [Capsicum chacoense]